MTSKDKRKKTSNITDKTDDESGASGSGSEIAFRDFIGTGDHRRDDLLPASEKRRLLSVHKDTHELRVKTQKEKRDLRDAVKNGKIPLSEYRQGMGMGEGMRSLYKANPALKDKAQFSGIDRQENMLPTENMAATNEEQRNELQNRLENRLTNTPKPGFNPRPQYR
jgi:hypothetical protein